jgi:hypothetical protein
MKRRLLHAAVVVTLMLCLAVGALWVRSYWATDEAGWTRMSPAPASHILSSAKGGVTYRHLTHQAG